MKNTFYESLLDLMVAIDSPQAQDKLLRNAEVTIGRAQAPLLVLCWMRGPMSVGELAQQAGRDESTVSHQLRKLELLGLIRREVSDEDERTRVVTITERGRAIAEKVEYARDRMVDEALLTWTEKDRDSLSQLLRRLADSASASLHRL